eukprot:CAMPEP_0119391360 /NCGR_PEP_ID=MMETSP1334-20130426/116796_1 /TAXON_ID=127549 /ORGANISM="Calcidiscus leptoporus, Strain RCC1130" /LENGTH=90 /DNA_ID=CAMNT_0007414021 /DNA_START=427 /DNA_END=696 /DNA_ORIENTATION=-
MPSAFLGDVHAISVHLVLCPLALVCAAVREVDLPPPVLEVLPLPLVVDAACIRIRPVPAPQVALVRALIDAAVSEHLFCKAMPHRMRPLT